MLFPLSLGLTFEDDLTRAELEPQSSSLIEIPIVLVVIVDVITSSSGIIVGICIYITFHITAHVCSLDPIEEPTSLSPPCETCA